MKSLRRPLYTGRASPPGEKLKGKDMYCADAEEDNPRLVGARQYFAFEPTEHGPVDGLDFMVMPGGGGGLLPGTQTMDVTSLVFGVSEEEEEKRMKT